MESCKRASGRTQSLVTANASSDCGFASLLRLPNHWQRTLGCAPLVFSSSTFSTDSWWVGRSGIGPRPPLLSLPQCCTASPSRLPWLCRAYKAEGTQCLSIDRLGQEKSCRPGPLDICCADCAMMILHSAPGLCPNHTKRLTWLVAPVYVPGRWPQIACVFMPPRPTFARMQPRAGQSMQRPALDSCRILHAITDVDPSGESSINDVRCQPSGLPATTTPPFLTTSSLHHWRSSPHPHHILNTASPSPTTSSLHHHPSSPYSHRTTGGGVGVRWD